MASPIVGRVLVVDSDYDTLDALARALRARDHHVVLAADGRGGLQRASELAPDVVLVDRDIPVVDIRTFLEVLRDNPRTSSAHAFILGSGDPTRLSALDGRAEPILKPFNPQEVAARIDDVLRARKGPPREAELRGDLAQVALFDLLQVFSVNRRTGRLRVEALNTEGEVWMREGQVIDATFGSAGGEKAIYRLLSVTRGRFVFSPTQETRDVRVRAPVDQLLMEAVRQSDEIGRIREELPPLASHVELVLIPTQCSRQAMQVAVFLDEPRSIEQLLDLVPGDDLRVFEGVRELLQLGAMRVLDTPAEEARLCQDDEAIAMRAAAMRIRRPGLEGAPRIGVLCRSRESLDAFSRAISAVKEYVSAPESPVSAGGSALGSLGALRIGDIEVELFGLPLENSFRPLWGTFLASAVVALVLEEKDVAEDVLEQLRLLNVKPVIARTGWDRSAGAIAAVRSAFSAVAPHLAGDDAKTVPDIVTDEFIR